MNRETVLVTGGAGFMGSALALALRQQAMRVVAFDNLRRRGSELNLPRLKGHGVEFVHGDVRSQADVDSCGPFDLMVDCSAEPSVQAGQNKGVRYSIDTNLGGTINCLERARKYGAAVIFISTSRVYPYDTLSGLTYESMGTRFAPSQENSLPGLSPKGISEDFPMQGVRSLYGATKLASELFLAEYGESFGIPYLVNRCGVIAGPGQYGKVDQGFATLWISRHEYRNGLAYLGYGGSGRQVRDVLHIKDLVDLVLTQLERWDQVNGQTFNVGGGMENSVSLLELTSHCRELTGCEIEIEADPRERTADLPWYITDNQKVTGATGWAPKRGILETLSDTLTWIREGGDSLKRILTQ